MKKLRVAALGLAAVLVLSGCGGGETGEQGSDKPKEELTVLTYAQGDGLKVYDKFFEKCSTETGYPFKQLQVPANELLNKAVQLTASGSGPAMIVADNQMVAGLADAGALSPIELGPLKPEDFVAGPFKSGEYDGQRYGIPIGNNGEIIVYNKKMLKDAGIEAPKSWDELTAAAKKLTKGDTYGFAQTFQAGETLSWNYWAQLWSAGGSIAQLDSPEAVKAAEFWASFVKDGTAPKASLQWQSDNVISEVAAGRVAMAQVGTWTLSDLLESAKKENVEIGMTTQVSMTGEPPIVPFGGEVFTAGSAVKGDALKAVNDCIVSWSTDTEGLAERDTAFGYLPSYIPAQEAVLKEAPYLKTLQEQLKTSRGRTEEVGPGYTSRSVAVSAALQQIATGAASAQDAMATAQKAAAS